MFWFVVIAAGAVWLVMNNTKRGAEFVRAHIYLSGLEAGFDTAEANKASLLPASHLPDHVIQSARQRAQADYSGKQFPLMKRAYEAGMTSRLPGWQRSIVMASKG